MPPLVSTFDLSKVTMTPMLQQWLEAKSAYPDALVFFRMGDFYELFGDDAVEAARLLELTLTSRDKDKEAGLPMAGVPHHAATGYLERLLALGRKVAVCDQIEDPKDAKGIVKRAVTRVVTPGVVVDDVSLEPDRANYLAAVWCGLSGAGLVWADVTTGELRGALLPDARAVALELCRVEPKELLLAGDGDAEIEGAARRSGTYVTRLGVEQFAPRGALADAPDEVRRALSAIQSYVALTRPRGDAVLGKLELVALDDFVVLEETTIRNLELVATLVGGRRKGSLLGHLDRTVTAMGARQLRRWIERPLRDKGRIENRLNAVEALKDDAMLRDDLRTSLQEVYDVERLGGRVLAGLASPKDLSALRRSLSRLPAVRDRLLTCDCAGLQSLGGALDPLEEVHARLAAALTDDPAPNAIEGRIIRDGFDAEVDAVVALGTTGKQWMVDYEAREQARTGIGSLKVRYNRVFGYYIEVSRPNLAQVPGDYIRKQTISTGERFYTVELKEYEERVLGAEDRRIARETQLFDALRAELRAHGPRLLRTAGRIADLDVLAALAEVAARHAYVRPTLFGPGEAGSGRLKLIACRHPVVEAAVGEGAGEFVPNDVVMDADGGTGGRLLLITGPNMAGKSTLMRQVAIDVLLAQVGSFVPAREAEIGLVDRIFTRVGATDDLSRGQSTFMVEMSETASIVKYASPRSLVLLDEIGRGTSTFDGLSIAWAVAEHLHDHTGARTLFATHYHELCELARSRPHVRNVHVAVREWNDGIVFLHRLLEGATNRSYGIQVGRLAGLPESVIARAKEVLAGLEKTDLAASGAAPPAHPVVAVARPQLSLFEAEAAPVASSELDRQVARVDVNRTTPLEALRLIDKWQKELKKLRP